MLLNNNNHSIDQLAEELDRLIQTNVQTFHIDDQGEIKLLLDTLNKIQLILQISQKSSPIQSIKTSIHTQNLWRIQLSQNIDQILTKLVQTQANIDRFQLLSILEFFDWFQIKRIMQNKQKVLKFEFQQCGNPKEKIGRILYFSEQLYLRVPISIKNENMLNKNNASQIILQTIKQQNQIGGPTLNLLINILQALAHILSFKILVQLNQALKHYNLIERAQIQYPLNVKCIDLNLFPKKSFYQNQYNQIMTQQDTPNSPPEGLSQNLSHYSLSLVLLKGFSPARSSVSLQLGQNVGFNYIGTNQNSYYNMFSIYKPQTSFHGDQSRSKSNSSSLLDVKTLMKNIELKSHDLMAKTIKQKNSQANRKLSKKLIQHQKKQ